MASIISAGTTTGTALSLTSDTSGELQIKTNNGSTTAMTLTTAGNVGVGTTTPLVTAAGRGNITINGSSSAILTFGVAGVSQGYIFNNGTDLTTLNDNVGAIIWENSGAERMRIDSSGNVGIGTTTPALSKTPQLFVRGNSNTSDDYIATFEANNATAAIGISYQRISSYDNANTAPLIFDTNGSERMRITSAGYLKASNTGTYNDSTGTYHEFRNNQNKQVVVLTNSIASGYTDALIQAAFTGYTPNTTGAWFFYCSDTTNQKAGILTTGTFESRTSTYGGVSDVKLKQDIVDASSQWDDIKNLRVRKFRFKDEVAADPDYPAYIGLIAQEAELVSPGLVGESPDFEEAEVTDEEGNVTKERKPTGTVTKSVKYSILYMKAVKALQEAMERIEVIEAKVEAQAAEIALLKSK
jgi:hypothetical protein